MFCFVFQGCDLFGYEGSDGWSLCNMFENMTYILNTSEYGWFRDPHPCNWTGTSNLQLIECDSNTNDVLKINMNLISDLTKYENITIDTSYWPLNLEKINFFDNQFLGYFDCSTFPDTLDSIILWGNQFYAGKLHIHSL